MNGCVKWFFVNYKALEISDITNIHSLVTCVQIIETTKNITVKTASTESILAKTSQT